MCTSTLLVDTIRRELAGRVDVSESQLCAFQSHFELLLKWNPKVQLTTVLDPVKAAIRHYCESAMVAAFLSRGPVLDFGSGAGFPGLVCAIIRPELEFYLLERDIRKGVFLREASRERGNVKVVSAPPSVEVACVTSRAVSLDDVLSSVSAKTFVVLTTEAIGRGRMTKLPWGDHRYISVFDADQ